MLRIGSIMLAVCNWSDSDLVSVPDPKSTPARIAFSFPRVILEVIYVLDEVWGRD